MSGGYIAHCKLSRACVYILQTVKLLFIVSIYCSLWGCWNLQDPSHFSEECHGFSRLDSPDERLKSRFNQKNCYLSSACFRSKCTWFDPGGEGPGTMSPLFVVQTLSVWFRLKPVMLKWTSVCTGIDLGPCGIYMHICLLRCACLCVCVRIT